ncbi:hypothetical protein MKEN_00241700 [Mycena kentingensis (nom. inval.)]|nr:hypothetical protein MKEN_00241700 [Mycena kentingensis (nom. inval.)]
MPPTLETRGTPSFPVTNEELVKTLKILEAAPNAQLPERYDRDGVRRADMRLGWLLQPSQQLVIAKWAQENNGGVMYNGDELSVSGTALYGGEDWARAELNMEAGVKYVYVYDKDDNEGFGPRLLFWIDSNKVVKEDRYSEAQWQRAADRLGFTGAPRWYISTDYMDHVFG